MSARAHHILRLATALLAGPLDDRVAMAARTLPLVGDPRKARWLDSLAKVLVQEFGVRPRPTARELAERIGNHGPYAKAWSLGHGRILPAIVEPQMAPAPGAPRSWKLPGIACTGELAELLGLHADDLGWLTAYGQAEHYSHRWHAKAHGGWRLIESPKPLLKLAQRRVLERILGSIPPHEAARGFRPGTSIRDFVAPHVGKDVLIRFDLEDFFPSITSTRILRIFLTAGYPENVARALTRLTTHATPTEALADQSLPWAQRRRLATPHLPQGSPTSPALANLAAFTLDCRLARLAECCRAEYTRYADDLLFSGGEDFARGAERFRVKVAAILLEEGFLPNHRKTRVQRQGQRQHAAGLVLNEKPNIGRRDFDRLKAILTNCANFGPASQNRGEHEDFRAHLQGKLAWVGFIHPGKGEKLRAIFERIKWD
ncbi:reverse transcriptase family protein [Haloferula sp. BvORR071]|uniref:reverse transcriptase family protein n=1 Tax=Haloferula sp. BvORR071 TaxID=1396141 RepID=UPI000555EB39|nr:reverse transcriptase family protein [Haloferula sp. BvORR071]